MQGMRLMKLAEKYNKANPLLSSTHLGLFPCLEAEELDEVGSDLVNIIQCVGRSG